MFVVDRDMVFDPVVQSVVAVSVFIPTLLRAATWWSSWQENHFEITGSALLVSARGEQRLFGRQEVVVAQLLGRDHIGQVLLSATWGDFPQLRVVDASGQWFVTGPLLIWRKTDVTAARLRLEAFMKADDSVSRASDV